MNESIRKWFDWRGWTVALSAVAIVIIVTAILSPAFRGLIADPATASWASALGTAAAAGTAVWLGLAEIRRRQAETAAQIDLLHEFFKPEGVELLQRIVGLEYLIAATPSVLYGTPPGAFAFEQARSLIHRPALAGMSPYFLQLVSFPRHRALAMARVLGSLPILRMAIDCTATEGDGTLVQSGVEKANTLLSTMKSDLKIALALDDEEYERLIEGRYDIGMEMSDRARRLQAKIPEWALANQNKLDA